MKLAGESLGPPGEAAGWGGWVRYAARPSQDGGVWFVRASSRAKSFRTYGLAVGGRDPGHGAADALTVLVRDLGFGRRDAERPREHFQACRDPKCRRCESLAIAYARFVEAFGPLALWNTDAIGEEPAGWLGAGSGGGFGGLDEKSDHLGAVLAAVELLQEQWTLLARTYAADEPTAKLLAERLLWGRWPQMLAVDIADQADEAGYDTGAVEAIREAVLRRPFDFLWRHMALEPDSQDGDDVHLATLPPARERAGGLLGESPYADPDMDPRVLLSAAEPRRGTLRSLLVKDHPAVEGHPQSPSLRLPGRCWRGQPLPLVAGDGLNYHCSQVAWSADVTESGIVRRYQWPSLFHALELHMQLCLGERGLLAGLCDRCWRPFWYQPHKGGSAKRRYCSDRCRQAAWQEQRRLGSRGAGGGAGITRASQRR